jgi:hypothetical protein
MGLRTDMYRGARLLGWAQAGVRGPGALLRRALRVALWRAAGRLINAAVPSGRGRR